MRYAEQSWLSESSLKLLTWKRFFKLYAEEISLAMVNKPFMEHKRVGQLCFKINHPDFKSSHKWMSALHAEKLKSLHELESCPKWREWGVCACPCTCICHSAIHTVFFISSESYFHQACLPCCFISFSRCLVKFFIYLFIFNLDVCQMLRHGIAMWESSSSWWLFRSFGAKVLI